MRRGVWVLVWTGLALSLLLAGGLSYYASGSPDGLERVADDVGLAGFARDSATAGSPLADYGVAGIGNERASGGLAGVAGVLLTAVVAFGLFHWLARRRRSAQAGAVAAGVRTDP